MNTKYAFKNMKKNKVQIFITICILFIGIAILYLSMIYSNMLIKEKEYVSNYFNNGRVYTIRLNLDYYDDLYYKDEENQDEVYKGIYNDLKKIDKLDVIQMINIGINFDSDFKLINGEDIENINYVEGKAITEETMNHYQLKLIEGKLFNEDKKEDKIINANVGYNLKNNFELGEIFEDSFGQKFRVSGFLEKNSELPEYIGENIDYKHKRYKLDNTILTGLNEFIDKNYSYYSELKYSFLHIDKDISKEEEEKVLKEIKEVFLKRDIKIGLQSQNRGIEGTVKEIENNATRFKVVSSIILIFVSLSIIMTILNSLEVRKKEFGVYILSGASLIDICKIVLYEVLIYFIISLVIVSLVIFKLKIFNLNIFLITLGIICIYILITFFIPIKKINGIDIKDLIKGQE